LVGDWAASSVTYDGNTLTVAQLAMAGEWTLKLASEDGEWVEEEDLPIGSINLAVDGTCEVAFNEDSPADCEWSGEDSEQGVVEFEDAAWEASIDEDGWLVLEAEDSESVLYYEPDGSPLEVTLSLDEDGGFVFEAMEEDVEGEWDWDGEQLTLGVDEEDPVIGHLEDDDLILEFDDDNYVTLVRE
jgi:hypothetical protein